MELNTNRLLIKVALVFLVTFAMGGIVIHLHEQNEIYKRQKVALEVASVHAHLLQEQTARSLSATYALAAVLKQGEGRINNFEEIATQMLALYGGISSLQLAPGGVIQHVVPLAGNEAAIGHDLLVDPARNKEAFAALETRKLTLAGPFSLRQGGVAVVGRLPVFLPERGGKEYFWGFTTALIKIPDLLAASRLGDDTGTGYVYELSRLHADSGQKEVFWASSKGRLEEPLSYRIEVPNGLWILNIAAVNGWSSSPTSLGLAWLCVLSISLMAGFLTYRLLIEPHVLAQQVAVRTKELSVANESLQEEIIEHWQTEMALRASENRLEVGVQERTAQLAAANSALQDEAIRQKALVEKLEDAQNQLLQSEMMASIGQLAAGVAHEINNPIGFVGSNLGTLKTFSQSLLDIVAALEALATEHAESESTQLAVSAIKAKFDLEFICQELPQLFADTTDGLSRIKRIVQDLKDFSRVDDTDWRLLDLNRSLDSTLNLLACDIGPKADVVKDFGDIPPVECLAFQINQVFLNLLLNAVQAITGRGEITVRTRHDGSWVKAEIVDTGNGITPENIGRIFEPFFSTKPVGQGTGLGLSLAYSIVKRHGGRIEVESEPGKGALFRIWLPLLRLK